MKHTSKILNGTIASAILLASTQGHAAIVYYSDLLSWQNAVASHDVFATTKTNVDKANEVSLGSKNSNLELGNVLTYDAVNTGLSTDFTVTALNGGSNSLSGFVFNDNEPFFGGENNNAAFGGFNNALSIGDINNFVDDDWQFSTNGSSSLTAFAFDLGDNRNENTESVTFLDELGNVVGSFDTSGITNIGNDEAFQFFGFTSAVAFSTVVYDEKASATGLGNDDISVANFRFGAATTVPEPTSLALLSLGLVGFGLSRKKKKA